MYNYNQDSYYWIEVNQVVNFGQDTAKRYIPILHDISVSEDPSNKKRSVITYMHHDTSLITVIESTGTIIKKIGDSLRG